MITEEQQWAIYEWRYPELKGKEWEWISDSRDAAWCDGNPVGPLPPLYIDGKPNMNLWHYECVPQLKAKKVDVWYASWNHWVLETETEVWGDDDPYEALVEMLEARNA